MLKNLTPQSMRCETHSCPGVYQRDDGMLLIVGENITDVERGPNEAAILIHPDLLADYVKQAKEKADE